MKNLSFEEMAVYELIKNSKRITQLEIAQSERWLGSHPKHEGHLNINHQQSTLRRVRQIIRNLRINHGIVILSDINGYWLGSREEAMEYLSRIEKVAKAQARAWFETYSAMKKNFGITSEYFNQQGKLFE